jgi:protein-tyrosine-phosphatase
MRRRLRHSITTGGILFQSYSAGSQSAGKVNPFALDVLREVYYIDAGEARSKGYDEFRGVTFQSSRRLRKVIE